MEFCCFEKDFLASNRDSQEMGYFGGSGTLSSKDLMLALLCYLARFVLTCLLSKCQNEVFCSAFSDLRVMKIPPRVNELLTVC